MTKFKLEKPITFANQSISEITIQEPKARDLRTLPTNPTTSDILDLASRLTGVAPAAIDEFSVQDALRLCNQVGSFFQPGSGTKS